MRKVIGIVGWKDVGKTFVVTEIIKLLVQKGYKVGSIKHAHHNFDIDQPGTDSFKHRKSGSSEVIISSSKRWAKIIENNNKKEKKLNELLKEFNDIDVAIVEGFKKENHPKIEIISQNSKIQNNEINNVVAIVADKIIDSNIPVFKKNDIESLTKFIINKFL
tara:strand:- start:1475 stop:1960 length:486 start_codon:yes stop_codon:yes gene_type:complete